METLSGILLIAALVVGAILILKILTKPIRWIFKLLLNAAFGFVLLFLVNFFGDPVGIYIGVNFVNALVAGFLGVPGVILLVLLKFLF
ncbi:MAG: pro-sigmaK processing inhibitor BofA family protein [Candidatus Limivicinus sp.]|nr:pro-sigmaK processing inhibitor BofA family protein [Candidatus Limivicinus sp.]